MSSRFELLALAFSLLPVSIWAQVAYNASGPYFTNSNTTAYQSGSAGQTSCTADNFQCPSCNGHNITNADDSNYQLLCGSYISSSAISQHPTPVTAKECLTACDGFIGCTGAYVSKQGACSLSVGHIFGTIKSDEYTAFVSIGDDSPVNSPTSASPISLSTSIALTAGTTIALSTHTPPAPFPNITHPTPFVPSNTSYPNPFGYSKPPYASGYGSKPTGVVSPNPPHYNTTAPPPWLVNATYGPNFTWPNTTLPSPSLANITYHPPNSTYPNATAPNTTHPTPLFPNATLPAPNTTCSLTNLKCPACNNHTITDSHNATYAVLCGYSLSSTSKFAFAEPLPAQYCLARCDERNATCAGAYWDDQECTLVLGTLRAPVRDPEFVAFIRVRAGEVVGPSGTGVLPGAALSTGFVPHGTGGMALSALSTGFVPHGTGGTPLPPLSTGLVPTGSDGSPNLPISSGLTWLNTSSFPEASYSAGPTAPPSLLSTGIVLSTATTAPPSTVPIHSTPTSEEPIVTITSTLSSEPTCNPTAISCPECDGLRIVDTANETYRLQCNFKPTCDSLVGFYGLASLNVCMQRCDKDATCLAAVFNQGHCDICQRGIEGEYDEDVDYLVLIPETVEEASVSASLGTATITSSIAAFSTSAASAATAPVATTLSVATPVFPSAAASNATTSGATTLTSAAPAFSVPASAPIPTASCNATAPTCPECNGITYTDPNKVLYQLDCDAVCTEQSLFAPRGIVSLDTCLNICDGDADCLAANYNPYGCGRCRNVTYDNITPEASYLLYIRKSSLATPPETEQPAPTSWENSPPILPPSFTAPNQASLATESPVASSSTTSSTSASAQPTLSLPSTISCPASDNASYRSSSDRSFNIACDSVLEADSFSQSSAADFDDCAAACTDECGGVQFSRDEEGCLLLTSVSVVASSAGWTAGVAVTWPGTAAEAGVGAPTGGVVGTPTGGVGTPLALTMEAPSPAAVSSTAGAVASSTTAAGVAGTAVADAPAVTSTNLVVATNTVTRAPSGTEAVVAGYGWRPWGGVGGGYPGGPANGRPHAPPGGWHVPGGGPWWGRGRPG